MERLARQAEKGAEWRRARDVIFPNSHVRKCSRTNEGTQRPRPESDVGPRSGGSDVASPLGVICMSDAGPRIATNVSRQDLCICQRCGVGTYYIQPWSLCFLRAWEINALLGGRKGEARQPSRSLIRAPEDIVRTWTAGSGCPRHSSGAEFIHRPLFHSKCFFPSFQRDAKIRAPLEQVYDINYNLGGRPGKGGTNWCHSRQAQGSCRSPGDRICALVLLERTQASITLYAHYRPLEPPRDPYKIPPFLYLAGPVWQAMPILYG